jgi:hypothetical protein
LRLAQLNNGAFEQLERHAALWRQVRQTLFTLEELRGRLRGPSRQHPWWREHDVPPDRWKGSVRDV